MLKKSDDRAVNQILIKAHKQGIDLAWDRADAMQPQCGFARLALCCSDCAAGPCRVSPFAESAPQTICGRDRDDLVAAALVRQAREGTLALVQLAGASGASMDTQSLLTACSGDSMVDQQSAADQLLRLAECAYQALVALNHARPLSARPSSTQVNLGVLQADQTNILISGHVPPQIVAELAAAAALQGAVLLSTAGNEVSGEHNLPIVTNYVSQETPLLTGAVDLLVFGSQCVQPAVRRLAAELGIPAVAAAASFDAQAVVAQACEHRRERAAAQPGVPAVVETLDTNYTASYLREALAGPAAGEVKGLVYFGGCGNIAKTQDRDLVKLATEYMTQGYLLVTAGCVGTALAKGGYCDAERHNFGSHELPRVMHIGACHDAAEFLAMAGVASEQGLPVAALFAELTHHKQLATALAFACAGVSVYADLEWAFLSESACQLLSGLGRDGSAGGLRPLADLTVSARTLAEVAVSK